MFQNEASSFHNICRLLFSETYKMSWINQKSCSCWSRSLRWRNVPGYLQGLSILRKLTLTNTIWQDPAPPHYSHITVAVCLSWRDSLVSFCHKLIISTGKYLFPRRYQDIYFYVDIKIFFHFSSVVHECIVVTSLLCVSSKNGLLRFQKCCWTKLKGTEIFDKLHGIFTLSL